jgi:isocitrate/isopropylmalate dehydrogenase
MQIAVFEGDGIGPEIISAALPLLEQINAACNLGLTLEAHNVGLAALSRCGTTFPDSARLAAEQADAIILGPLSTFEYPDASRGGVNVSAFLRTQLDLYANIRPVRTIADLGLTAVPFDVVIVRENTEGFYAVRSMHAGSGEFAPDADTAFALRKITASSSRRIAQASIDIARKRSGRVTAVHKANVLTISDGLFLRECRACARQAPDIVYNEIIVDAAAAALVSSPQAFDVIVTTNLFGDILSNLAAAVGGGLGIAGSINFGFNAAMAQAAHGSAPDIAGQGVANPSSIIFSIAMLLGHLGTRHRRTDLALAGNMLLQAVTDCLGEGPSHRTPDLGGELGTNEFAAAVSTKLDQSLAIAERRRHAK